MNVLNNVAGGNHSWTIPETFYAQIPNAKTGKGTIRCITYNGGTQIGTKDMEFIVTTNESICKPSLSASLIDINEDSIALTGDNTKIIKYASTAQISITTEAKKNASISSKKVNNITVSGNVATISNVETNTFVVTVTDSRGYSNSVTLSPTTINYIPLTVNATVKRTRPTTGEVDIEFTGNYFNGSFGSANNTLAMTWAYREKGDTTWITGGNLTPVISNNQYSNGNSAISLGNIFNYQKTYEIYLNIVDKLTTLSSYYTVTQGTPVLNWGKDYLNVNGDIRIYGESISDKLSYSTDEIKTLEKWIDGKPIYRKVINGTKVSGTDLSLSIGSNISKIVNVSGHIREHYVIPYYENSTIFVRVEFNVSPSNNGTVIIKSGTSEYSNGATTIIVEYTKTTD